MQPGGCETWWDSDRSGHEVPKSPNNKRVNTKKPGGEIELKKVNQPTLNKKQIKKNIQSKIENLNKSIASRKKASNLRTTISNSNLSNANKEKLLNNVNTKIGLI